MSLTWVWHGSNVNMAFETKFGYHYFTRQSIVQLGFKRHATAMQRSNLIPWVEFAIAVAQSLKQALVWTRLRFDLARGDQVTPM